MRREEGETRARKRAAGTKKTALFDIVNRGAGERFAARPLRPTGAVATSATMLRLPGRGAMRAEVQNVVDEIKQSVGLLRRHL
jgi:hypothetical protein